MAQTVRAARQVAFLALVIILTVFLGEVAADPVENFGLWRNHWYEKQQAGEWEEAEKAGRALMNLAANHLANNPHYLHDAEYCLGFALVRLDQYDEAEKLLTSSLDYYHAEAPLGDDSYFCWLALVTLHERLENYDKAIQAQKSALRIAEHNDEGPSSRQAEFLTTLGFLYRDANRGREAIEVLERCLSMRRTLAESDEDGAYLRASAAYNLGMVLNETGRPIDAEPYLVEAFDLFEDLYGVGNVDTADAANELGKSLRSQNRLVESAERHRLALQAYERAGDDYLPERGRTLVALGVCVQRLRKADEAGQTFAAAVEAFEQAYESDPEGLADELLDMTYELIDVARLQEAEAACRRRRELLESQSPIDAHRLASSISMQAWVAQKLGRFGEADALYGESMALRESIGAQRDVMAATALAGWADLCRVRGQLVEATDKARAAVEIFEESRAAPDELSTGVVTLANVLWTRGRFIEAEALYQRNLQLLRESVGEESSDFGWACNDLAVLYRSQGKHRSAMALYRRALEVFRAGSGDNHPDVATVWHNLSELQGEEGQYEKAEELARAALAVYRATGPEGHPDIAEVLINVAWLRFKQGDHQEAEQLWNESLAMLEASFGPTHPLVGYVLIALADMCRAQHRFAEGEAHAQRVLAMARSEEHDLRLLLPGALLALAELHYDQDQPAEAEREIDEAIAEAERLGTGPGERGTLYALRARIAWKQDQRDEAVADLRRAMRLAEQQRGMSSGAERERAASFGEYSELFEQMVRWQLEVGDMTEAFYAFERSRARSLLDELRMLGANLNLDLSAAERAEAEDRAQAIKQTIVTIENQLRSASAEQREALLPQLTAARQAAYDLHRSRRSASAIYQGLLSQDVSLPRISQLQRELVGQSGLLLEYFLGQQGGYLLAIDGRGATLHALEVSDEAARSLEVEPGPLTLERCRKILIGDGSSGIVPRLAKPHQDASLSSRLASMYKTLVPAEYRQRIAEQSVQRMYLLPDGPLALLPFESLVDDSGFSRQYLLEVGPPMVYAPSVTVLDELRRRSSPAPRTDEGPLLVSLGDPQYARLDTEAVAHTDESPASRFHAAGGQLAPLPFSGIESRWVVEHFEKRELPALSLTGAAATERRLRELVDGCIYVHLACHGHADLAMGNFFGALALTPGDETDPADDGFLTLEETYDLDLSRCELAVLSACQTNFGEQQQGEGVWSLSRGFISAGARRVLATNWLVDDRAAASLISVFYDRVCQQRAAGEPVDHAAALQEAKRWVHSQDKWKHPYFWSTFVLLGPP